MPMFIWIVALYLLFPGVCFQTEGNTGYDYNAYYDYDDYSSVLDLEPEFAVPFVNVTVVAGQTAVLPCSIDYLGKYKVIWMDQNSVPLTYDDRRMVDDPRFSVVRPYIKEWNLAIQDVRPRDEGIYFCTVNTNPVRKKLVNLHVKVPARIIEEETSDDITVLEGDRVVLTCQAEGIPKPVITWYWRPTLEKPAEDHERCLPEYRPTGEEIVIQNITRHCSGVYGCIASNYIPPAASRVMRVSVEFLPEVTLPVRCIASAPGHDVTLRCEITAPRDSSIGWQRGKGEHISSDRHVVVREDLDKNTILFTLQIRALQEWDFGTYTCVVSNLLGHAEGTMYVDKQTQSSVDGTSTPKLQHVCPTKTNEPPNSVPGFHHYGSHGLGLVTFLTLLWNNISE